MNGASRMEKGESQFARPIEQKITRYQMPIFVRPKYGEELAGLQVDEDGLTFESPHPIPVGRIVEMVLCGGAILIDAEIKACEPILAGAGRFMIHTEFHHTSSEMRQLVSEEITRHQQEA